jgi:hypothetical protein
MVTTDADSGADSLREAILAANFDDTKDTITFAIGSGPQTIAPATPLPAITQPVEIDGTTQPGFTGTPIIEIDGSNLESGSAALVLQDHVGSTIRGLVVVEVPGDTSNGGGGDGILLDGGGGHTIEGNTSAPTRWGPRRSATTTGCAASAATTA